MPFGRPASAGMPGVGMGKRIPHGFLRRTEDERLDIRVEVEIGFHVECRFHRPSCRGRERVGERRLQAGLAQRRGG